MTGEPAAGSETRMKTYYPMFQQQATHDYKERFHASELIREHETLSIRAPGQMFQALQVPEKIHQTDLVALQKIIHLAASTLDLEVVREHVREHQDAGKKKKDLDALVADSAAALQRLRLVCGHVKRSS